MDAAQSNIKKTVFFLATALLLTAPFHASAQTLSASSTIIALGSASCNDYQQVNLTSSGGANSPITFTVAVNYPNGSSNGDSNGQWLYATLESGGSGTTSTGATISGSTGNAGVAQLQIGLARYIGSVSDTATVTVTPTSPAGNAITITVNYAQNANCGNTGTNNNNYISYTPTSISLSAAPNLQQSQTVTIKNISTATYIVNASVGQVWDSVSANQITLTPGETDNFSVTANAAETAGIGNYSDTLILSPATGYAGNPIDISVAFTVSSNGGGTTTGSGDLTVNGGTSTSVSLNYISPNNTASSCVNLVDTTSGVTGYSWSVSTANGGNWLLANNSFSNSTSQVLAPGTPGPPCINLTLNSSVLSSITAGAYQGTVKVTDIGGNDSSATINVNLYVAGPVGPNITVSPSAIYVFPNVAADSNVQQPQETFTVSAPSGYTLDLPTLGGQSSVFSLGTPTENGNSVSFTVFSNPGGLSSGIYTNTITVTGGPTGGATSNTVITVVQPIGQSTGTTTGGGTTSVEPTSLTFQQESGSSYWISGKEAQAITITGAQGTAWSASINLNGASFNWLTFDGASGGTFNGPATLMVDLFNGIGNLAPSSTPYQATVQITTTNGAFDVNVSVLVTASNVPVLLAYPASTTFSANSGSNPSNQTVTVVGSDNTSSTTLPAISAGTPSATWLSASTSGNQLILSVNIGNLGTGVYSATVPVSSSAYANNIQYPVVLVVNGGGGGTSTSGALTLSPSTISFTNVTSQISQSLDVTASSSTVFSVSYQETSCTSSTWLQVASGSYTAGSNATAINVQVNPSGIANGTTCTGVISLVTASGTQTVNVSMTTAGSSGSGNVTVSPTTMTFPYVQGGTVPAAQTATIINTNSATASIPFTVSVTPANSWLQTSVSSASTPYNNPGLSVSVVPGSLTPNTYTGTVTITPNGGTAVTINVTLTVTSTTAVTASPTTLSMSYTVGGTSPTATIQVTAGGAAAAFTATANSTGGWLQVSPTSGTTPNTGTFNLTVSTVASALASLSPSATPYTGTITVQATSPATGSTIVNVSLTVTAPLPVISSVINAASGVGGTSNVSVSPGEIISLFAPSNGQNPFGPASPVQLNSTTCPSPCTSVPTSMGGVQVFFLPGNYPAPLLYVGSGQINAVVPYQMAGIASFSVEVQYLQQKSNAFSLTLATTAPGIFTAAGSEQAAAYQYDTQGNFSYNTAATPAKAGWTIVFYVTGEGVVVPAANTGAVTVAASAPPYTPVPAAGAPSVRIGTQPATVSFYGEAPNFVSGLMQLNVVVPSGAGTGAVPIVVTVGNNSSQAGVTVALQ